MGNARPVRFPSHLLIAVVSIACGASARPIDLRDGDLVFQTSRSMQSKAVALATRSHLTHMGVVFIDRGEPWVLEAVEPVKRTRVASHGASEGRAAAAAEARHGAFGSASFEGRRGSALVRPP